MRKVGNPADAPDCLKLDLVTVRVRWLMDEPLGLTAEELQRALDAAEAWNRKRTKEKDADETVWVLISKLEPPRIVNLTERRRCIETHPDIRHRRPKSPKTGKEHPRRMEVHIGDWVTHWGKVNRQAFDSLDGTNQSSITSDELAEDFMHGAAQRYNALLRKKKSKKKPRY
jgi:hypothetical protein